MADPSQSGGERVARGPRFTPAEALRLTREEYRRHLESLSEADLLDEVRRVARAEAGRREMSTQYIACWYACADRGLPARFSQAVQEVRAARQQQDEDNRQRLEDLGTNHHQENAP